MVTMLSIAVIAVKASILAIIAVVSIFVILFTVAIAANAPCYNYYFKCYISYSRVVAIVGTIVAMAAIEFML